MTRPRWHDVLIAASIAGILGLGVWALWWDDVRGMMGWGVGSGSEPTAIPASQTSNT